MVRNLVINSQELKRGLYEVSTPIGNLGDITLRGLDILRNSNYILCEDTRNSKILLNKYEIKSNLIAYHKFNEKKVLSKILELLKSGAIISLISDAGTPGISDPGAILINECIKNKIQVIPVPGPSSVISAVSVSGFSNQFFFYGFFPEKNNLLKDIKKLSQLNSSIVFFISPKKINKIIPILKENFNGRKILICKEMTKYFEDFVYLDIEKLEKFDFELKGELTLVISEKKENKKDSQKLSESDKRIINKLINKLSIKEITNLINEKNNISKKEIYNFCLKIKNEK